MSSEENQFNVQGYNIVTILKRLEAATSRLEDISIFQAEHSKKKGCLPSNDSVTEVSSDPSSKDIPVISAAPSSATFTKKSKALESFSIYIEEYIKPLTQKSALIDETLGLALTSLQTGFEAQLKFLENAEKSTQPNMDDPALMDALKPMNEQIQKINTLKEQNRTSKFSNQLNTISEGSPILGWIVNPTPISYIPEIKDSCQYWSNRVLKEYKDKDEAQVEWVRSFISIFDALKDVVKEYFPTGPVWNPTGKSLRDVLAEQSSTSYSTSASGSTAPPPPPPPPPPVDIFDNSSAPAATEGGMGAVFADLNKGENITSGLKKVDKSQMTHKNPELRRLPSVGKKPTLPRKPNKLSTALNTAPIKKPASKELVDGSKWIINNFTEQDLQGSASIEIEVEMHQSVFIGHCEGVTIQIKGKANAVSISETKKIAVVVDSLVSGLDLIKSDKFGLQITGRVPMVNIDKCNDGSVYLSQESVDADIQVFTSCSTSINLNIPVSDDYTEMPVPEQFVHTIKDGKLISNVVEHAG